MKTFFYFIATVFISTGAMFAGLIQHTPLLGYGIGFGIWALFFWRWQRRSDRRRKF